MTEKKIAQLSEEFDALTIKKQMKILANKAAKSKQLYFKEIMEEFEKTLLQALYDKYDYNKLNMSLGIKMHRNTITQKMKKFKIREKRRKSK